MNPSTSKIATLLTSAQNEPKLEALLHAITLYGSAADAQYLLPLFLQTKDDRLLKPLQVHGNQQMAATLFAHAIEGGKLKENFPYETLTTLSYLQHAPTEAVLIEYFKGLADKNLHWDLHVAVCHALLNYPCNGYQTIIKEEIEKCLERWLFPEMIPALAIKTGDPSLAERLYHHGSTKASSDAVAGIILGLALFGESQRQRFKEIILNPDWEAASTGTGNVYYTLMGMSRLNITFTELHHDITALAPTETERMHQHLFLLASLLQEKLRRTVPYSVRGFGPHPEPFAHVYQALFEPRDGNSVFELARQYVPEQWLQQEVEKEFEQLQQLYKQKLAHETEIAFITQQG